MPSWWWVIRLLLLQFQLLILRLGWCIWIWLFQHELHLYAIRFRAGDHSMIATRLATKLRQNSQLRSGEMMSPWASAHGIGIPNRPLVPKGRQET